jgi:hypothetical protein
MNDNQSDAEQPDGSPAEADKTTELLGDAADSTSDSGDSSGGILGDRDGDRERPPTSSTTQPASRQSGGPLRRLIGLLALLLGTVGVLASLVGAGFGLRVLFGAGGMAEAALAPVAEIVDRMESRIDQTDDALNSRGVTSDRMEELQARAQGLADLTDSAVNSFERVDEHPIYQYFPAALDDLGDDLADYQATAETLNRNVVNAQTLSSTEAGVLSDEINDLQAAVTDTRVLVTETVDRLVGWIRLAGLAGFLIGLWSLWAQLVLVRRGWRGLAGRRF